MQPAAQRQDRILFCKTFALFAAGLGMRLGYAASLPIPVRFGFTWAYPAVAVGSVALSFYAARRLGWRAASYMLNGLALFAIGCLGMGFVAQACFYSGRAFPFVDEALARADRLLGFDWLAYMRVVEGRSWLDPVLSVAYDSITWQPILIIAALALRHDAKRICAFLSTQMAGLMLVCAIAAVFPALGAFHQYNVVVADHPLLHLDDPTRWAMPILWLREAKFATPVSADIGLVTFPSFHAFCAALYIWAAWSIPKLREPALALNTAMLVATPLYGSHYLVDILVGGALAIGLIVVSARAMGLDRSPTPRPFATKLTLAT